MSEFILMILLTICIIMLTGGVVCVYKALQELKGDISLNLDNIDNTLRDMNTIISEVACAISRR